MTGSGGKSRVNNGDEASSSHSSENGILEPPVLPQSNMVLRKRIRRIKQGMKLYNNQLTSIRKDLKSCRTKIADQQKQIVDYATRLDDNDKKNEEMTRKFSTLLQVNFCLRKIRVTIFINVNHVFAGIEQVQDRAAILAIEVTCDSSLRSVWTINADSNRGSAGPGQSGYCTRGFWRGARFHTDREFTQPDARRRKSTDNFDFNGDGSAKGTNPQTKISSRRTTS